jgi:hypothetical protein
VEDDDDWGEQPIPKPSRPSQDDVVGVGLVVGELDGAAVEAGGELDAVVVGGGQPTPSPKSPSH